jgi:hypothetical protein
VGGDAGRHGDADLVGPELIVEQCRVDNRKARADRIALCRPLSRQDSECLADDPAGVQGHGVLEAALAGRPRRDVALGDEDACEAEALAVQLDESKVEQLDGTLLQRGISGSSLPRG